MSTLSPKSKNSMMKTLWPAVVLIAVMTTGVQAQGKKRVERAADLPRFSYPVSGKVEQLVRDDAAFAKFGADVRRDTESVLAQYEIADKSVERQMLSVLAQLDYLEGKYDDALKRTEQIRALQEKPADKLLSGMQLRAMVAASKASGNNPSSAAWQKAVSDAVTAELTAMPYDVVSNDVKSLKSRMETTGETLILGGVREVLQTTADKTGALSSDLAPRVVGARYGLLLNLPLKRTLVDTYATYLAANRVDKPEIWSVRNVELAPGFQFAPVRIAVWDSGTETALFPKQVVRDAAGKPAVIGFDKFGNPANTELQMIAPELQGRLPMMRARTKGFSDLRSNVDSPEATEVKLYLSSLKPDEYKSAIEEISLAGNYGHGTHVGGIAMAGNPYASLVIARIEFNHKLLPEPCPSREYAERDARNMQTYVDFMKANSVRVVNMSWSGDVRGFESALEMCGIGKDPAERKTLAREYFDMEKNSLLRAFQSAPDILFVAAAGNANVDASFNETVPAGLSLPNLITVGAVDHAGDEAAFTSYGPTVVVHANGYQVDSYMVGSGGGRVALSGTSMSAPQVTNLAGKMLAVNPRLKPAQLIAIMRETAEKTADGRRILIHPANAVAAAQKRRA